MVALGASVPVLRTSLCALWLADGLGVAPGGSARLPQPKDEPSAVSNAKESARRPTILAGSRYHKFDATRTPSSGHARAVRIPSGLWKLTREVARHLLRRPVVGIAAIARTPDGRYILIRRSDTGQWALPGGTLEWGETLRVAIERELLEEAGTRLVSLGDVVGVYSNPERDIRFHAVTIVVEATVAPPSHPPDNPLEILEVRAFSESELPRPLSHGMTDMLQNGRAGRAFWE
ncbi:MAG TPA: NUDIX hydrolase [Polyangiaceae bacterium]|nr:NUDIX hydrolase [Polyangiaceae bacterium]